MASDDVLVYQTAPVNPIHATGDTFISKPENREQVCGYLGLLIPNRIKLRRWICMPINVKYFAILQDFGMKVTGDKMHEKGFRLLRQWKKENDEVVLKVRSEQSGQQDESDQFRFHHRVRESVEDAKAAYATEPSAYLACILHHWWEDLVDWQLKKNKPLPTTAYTDFAEAFRGEEGAAVSLETQFQNQRLGNDDLPLGLEIGFHPIENEYEQYNRLFTLNRLMRTDIIPNWVDFFRVNEAAQRQWYRNAMKPKWWGSAQTEEEPVVDPDQLVRDYVKSLNPAQKSCPQLPCTLTLHLDNNAKKQATIAIENSTREGPRLPQLQLRHEGWEHPGLYLNQGHWRQRIRRMLKLRGYGLDISDITAFLYARDKDHTNDDDWDDLSDFSTSRVELNHAEVAKQFTDWSQEYGGDCRVVIQVDLVHSDRPYDESRGLPVGLDFFFTKDESGEYVASPPQAKTDHAESHHAETDPANGGDNMSATSSQPGRVLSQKPPKDNSPHSQEGNLLPAVQGTNDQPLNAEAEDSARNHPSEKPATHLDDTTIAALSQ